MNIGLLRERDSLDRRVALTPPVVRQLTGRGNVIWVESGAGVGAMFKDDEYIRAGAQIGYSSAEVIHRSELIVRIAGLTASELELAPPGIATMGFYHMAVAGPALRQALLDREITAIGCEIIRTADGRLPVLAAGSEIAGQMTIPLAHHLLRSSSGGRGILLGGSLGVPPARVMILGAGNVGSSAARAAKAAGANVLALDIDSEKLRRLMAAVPGVATALADPESIAAAVALADVIIGAVLVPGATTPHVVTKRMVDSMLPGSVIIDVAIDQGGCVETSRPTTIKDPAFVYHGVVHYCVPNMTGDMGRSTSIAVAQALMPYLIRIGDEGLDNALLNCEDLARGVYTRGGHSMRHEAATT